MEEPAYDVRPHPALAWGLPPPDKRERATPTVLEQAEVLSERMAAFHAAHLLAAKCH